MTQALMPGTRLCLMNASFEETQALIFSDIKRIFSNTERKDSIYFIFMDIILFYIYKILHKIKKNMAAGKTARQKKIQLCLSETSNSVTLIAHVVFLLHDNSNVVIVMQFAV